MKKLTVDSTPVEALAMALHLAVVAEGEKQFEKAKTMAMQLTVGLTAKQRASAKRMAIALTKKWDKETNEEVSDA